MFCKPVAFTKTTKTIQTATNKGLECWISGNHRNHRFDDNDGNPGYNTGSQINGFRIPHTH